MKNIIVFGKNGQLARILKQENSDFQLVFIGSNEFNLDTQLSEIYNYILSMQDVEAIINASAFTNVDAAEFESPILAWRLNAEAPAQMAKACYKLNIPFIHISTESVFDGRQNKAYNEKHTPNPVNFYGLSKFAGEKTALKTGANTLIIRTSWLFSKLSQNFLGTMIKLAKSGKKFSVVNDQIGLPTYAPSLAKAIFTALQNMPEGQSIYHFAGAGVPVSRYDFAKEIIKHAGLRANMRPVSSEDFGAIAPRPKNATLDSAKFTSMFGQSPMDWKKGLEEIFV